MKSSRNTMMEAPLQKATPPLPVQPNHIVDANKMVQPEQDFKTATKEDAPLVKWAKEQTPPLPVQRQPLTDEDLLKCLVSVDPETKRLPPGLRDFARAIEAAHNIGAK